MSFDKVKQKFFPEGGVFPGIKLYAPLGYPCNIYKKNDLQRCSHLKSPFQYCETHKLPVTAHGSPNGMIIPDGLNYLRYDMKYNNERITGNSVDINLFLDGKAKDNMENRKYSILRAVDYLDYICNRPSLWEQVLTDFPGLKLCLAHFGSMNTWLKLLADSVINKQE